VSSIAAGAAADPGQAQLTLSGPAPALACLFPDLSGFYDVQARFRHSTALGNTALVIVRGIRLL
jgi:hypothetical protein